MRLALHPDDGSVTREDTPQGHVYTRAGRRYPSATALISELWPYNGPPNDGSAARIGTTVHDVMADLARGGVMRPEMIFAQPELAHVLRLKRHLDRVAEVYAVERPMASAALGLGGTVDLVCRLDGQLAIVDWKTKSREPDDRALDMHHLQAAIYAEMWRELTGDRPAATYVIASWPDNWLVHERSIEATLPELYSDRVMAALNRVRAGVKQ